MWRICFLLLAACGAPGPTSNHLLAPDVAPEIVKPPRVAILVTNEAGLHRYQLDTGRTELLDNGSILFVVDGSTWIRNDGDKYVIARGREVVLSKGVQPSYEVNISHDKKRFAVPQGEEIAIVSIADGSTQRVSLGPRVTRERHDVQITWTKDNTALIVNDGVELYRLDLATGARTPADSLDLEANVREKKTECASKGLRLERRVQNKQQQVVLVPLASKANPEELSTMGERVLVAATNYPDTRIGKVHPDTLELAGFLPACEHFVFTLEGRVYLASVATGQFTFLMRGRAAYVP